MPYVFSTVAYTLLHWLREKSPHGKCYRLSVCCLYIQRGTTDGLGRTVYPLTGRQYPCFHWLMIESSLAINKCFTLGLADNAVDRIKHSRFEECRFPCSLTIFSLYRPFPVVHCAVMLNCSYKKRSCWNEVSERDVFFFPPRSDRSFHSVGLPSINHSNNSCFFCSNQTWKCAEQLLIHCNSKTLKESVTCAWEVAWWCFVFSRIGTKLLGLIPTLKYQPVALEPFLLSIPSECSTVKTASVVFIVFQPCASCFDLLLNENGCVFTSCFFFLFPLLSFCGCF